MNKNVNKSKFSTNPFTLLVEAAAMQSGDEPNQPNGEDVMFHENKISVQTITMALRDSSYYQSAKFPGQLMAILLSNDECVCNAISWLPDGNGFFIKNSYILVEKVLPLFSRKTELSSFKRKLNRWGFRRGKKSQSDGSFQHKFFQRDRPELCHKMTCMKVSTKFIVKKKKKKNNQNAKVNPNDSTSLPVQSFISTPTNCEVTGQVSKAALAECNLTFDQRVQFLIARNATMMNNFSTTLVNPTKQFLWQELLNRINEDVRFGSSMRFSNDAVLAAVDAAHRSGCFTPISVKLHLASQLEKKKAFISSAIGAYLRRC